IGHPATQRIEIVSEQSHPWLAPMIEASSASMAMSILRGGRDSPDPRYLFQRFKKSGPSTHDVPSLRRRRCLGPRAWKNGATVVGPAAISITHPALARHRG